MGKAKKKRKKTARGETYFRYYEVRYLWHKAHGLDVEEGRRVVGLLDFIRRPPNDAMSR